MRLDKQTLIWSACLVAVTAAFFLLVTNPQFKRIREVTTSIEVQRTQLLASQSVVDSKTLLQQELAKLAAQNADFDAKIPEQEMLGTLLETLARSAQDHKLRPEGVVPGTPIRSQQVIALPITFKVRGPFRDVYGLVKDVEHMPRLTQFERFKAETIENQPGSVSAEMRMRIFFRAS